jgi:lipoate-protein ligase A
MYLLSRNHTDPYFNIAAEEYLLKNGPGDLFMLWRNEPCVIIGKHQNPYAETNFRFISETGIPVIRRISGGGAVYHDQGNINFSFVQKVGTVNPVRFSRFTVPILELINDFALNVTCGQRNDLLINGFKFSGNAEHVFREKVLHHGTLLFNTNLDVLNQCLQNSVSRFTGKSVLSVRSNVANLSEYLKTSISTDEFMNLLFENVKKKLQVEDVYSLTDNDICEINKLVEEKYKTWEWNFGYTPDYSFDTSWTTPRGLLRLSIKVERGCITGIEANPEFKKSPEVEEIVYLLNTKRHRPDEIRSVDSLLNPILLRLGISESSFVAEFF